ncbi:DegT/DnrJ/EryC1/StrS family aminotransferase [Hymenobacter oligotrophus]|uniref:DegT/DnrJ/EryC1/StrS family aminotransferase n=1 Tax=Hymenobacter oligotrophus TaxID=2319843 RepID=A0A3B7RSM8_9BACT|nr:DegT/DnrJ/EryC1/StrS family aminotransferase [Hymenobacter oligotrophus]AYA37127.1 DegT/DnrJ/EryC1/StrS family aminotransferase [Hymenobacter oligotrophus]
MITVTKTFLPPLEEYHKLLNGIWERGWLTNEGPLVERLEEVLKQELGVKHLFFVSNGTLALQLAIKALALKGDIITTPFSYVATTSSIVWEGCRPVFVDICPETLCLDPAQIESAITPDTRAILATHVFGTPCDVEAIARIASRHNLRVIYDAAHAFGVSHLGQSVLNSGDVSTLSFHATKLFHTGEGGAVITTNDELAHRLSYMRNFGHNGPNQFIGLGINAKNSELHAAMGLSVLPYVPQLMQRRQALSALYDALLTPLDLQRPMLPAGASSNYSYYPVLFRSEEQLLTAVAALNSHDIYPRRYFYPALTNLPYTQGAAACPVAASVASRVLCLPLYYELAEAQVEQIAQIITEVCQRKGVCA